MLLDLKGHLYAVLLYTTENDYDFICSYRRQASYNTFKYLGQMQVIVMKT